MHSIDNNKYLKEFIIANPPTFKISNKCCTYAKKKVGHKLISENHYDLNIVGVRRAEGGVRATAYKSCFSENKDDECDEYRPLFWYKNEDKNDYEVAYFVEHSNCYTEYDLLRTGCSGCPFGRDFEHELEVIQEYEPKLYKAVNHIFGESYEYTRQYREFCKEMKEKEKGDKLQILDDEVYYIQEILSTNPNDSRIAVIYPQEFYGNSILKKNIPKMLTVVREYIDESDLYYYYKDKILSIRWDSQKTKYVNKAIEHQSKVDKLSKIMNDGINPYVWYISKISDELIYCGCSLKVDYLVSLESSRGIS